MQDCVIYDTINFVIQIRRTIEFQQWFEKESLKTQVQIEARIANIELHKHFGDVKNLGEGLAELRWKSGRRIYFTVIEGKLILLLIGGIKNAQNKDIKKARLLIKRYTEDEA